MNNFDSFDLFSMFGQDNTDATNNTQESKEEKPVTVENVTAEVANETVDISDEAEDDTDEVTDSDAEEAKAKKAPAKKATTKKETMLVGPVKLIGVGFTFEYGEAGKKYKPVAVVKAAYDAGYKEVLLADLTHDGKSTICMSIDKKASDDDLQMGSSVTVMLGEQRATYTTEDFDGLEKEEISIFDLTCKFIETHPEFKGCGLKFDSLAQVAMPVFDKKIKFADVCKPENKFYNNSQFENINIDTFDDCYKNEDFKPVYHISDSNNVFISTTLKNRITFTAKDAGLEGTSTNKKIKEVYRLPFTLWIETYGTKRNCTAEDFGKDVVTKEEVIDYLKRYYRAFNSKTKKFDIAYDRASHIVGVALVSGEKGAATMAAPFNVIQFPMTNVTSNKTVRTENTEIGTFTGLEDVVTHEVSNVDFTMSLPKIPGTILNEIVREFKKDLTKENMLQIYWSVENMCYYLVKPKATYTKVRVNYELAHSMDVLVMTVHSHNTMPAIFSNTDDNDEIYTGLFGVIGNLNKQFMSASFRAGMEGSFKTLSITDLFSYGNGGECA